MKKRFTLNKIILLLLFISTYCCTKNNTYLPGTIAEAKQYNVFVNEYVANKKFIEGYKNRYEINEIWTSKLLSPNDENQKRRIIEDTLIILSLKKNEIYLFSDETNINYYFKINKNKWNSGIRGGKFVGSGKGILLKSDTIFFYLYDLDKKNNSIIDSLLLLPKHKD